MLYTILCYNNEDVIWSQTKEQDAAVMDGLIAVTNRLTAEGKMGPALRLLPTTSAATLRKGEEFLVVDGPFAETKEQLLGFYVVEAQNLDGALDIARQLGAANPGGAFEVRPVALYFPDARTDPQAGGVAGTASRSA